MSHVSRVTCHMSHVTCHVSHVTCHMYLKKKIGQSGEAYRWRVCNQRGLPRLVPPLLGCFPYCIYFPLFLVVCPLIFMLSVQNLRCTGTLSRNVVVISVRVGSPLLLCRRCKLASSPFLSVLKAGELVLVCQVLSCFPEIFVMGCIFFVVFYSYCLDLSKHCVYAFLWPHG